MISKRRLVMDVLQGRPPAYVPWSISWTNEAYVKLQQHYGCDAIDAVLDNHFLFAGNSRASFEPLGNDRFRDIFGVVWDRSIDKDIGVVENILLPEPSLKGFHFPDPLHPKRFEDIPETLTSCPDKFRVFPIGFSLYERAWTLRGMQNLLMDFYDHPGFVRQLFNAIADYNIAQINKAAEYDIDCVYFGDDWGQQKGLQMGYPIWKEFIYPVLQRLYNTVHKHHKFVMIHSCGDVAILFDDLVKIGVNLFNPFQPEVMAVFGILKKYRGKLSFHGGLSTQKTLPYGSEEEVKIETRKLLEQGRHGGYIFAPAHAIEGDVPLQNMLAFIEVLHSQKNYRKA